MQARVNATGFLPVDWFRDKHNVSCDQVRRIGSIVAVYYCLPTLYQLHY
jgi:hypothetical protein